MTKSIQTMGHKQARAAQIGLSYFFLLGFFIMIYLQGIGYLKVDVIGELKDVLMLVMSFWFMRQRETATDEPKPNFSQPANPAPQSETPK